MYSNLTLHQLKNPTQITNVKNTGPNQRRRNSIEKCRLHVFHPSLPRCSSLREEGFTAPSTRSVCELRLMRGHTASKRCIWPCLPPAITRMCTIFITIITDVCLCAQQSNTYTHRYNKHTAIWSVYSSAFAFLHGIMGELLLQKCADTKWALWTNSIGRAVVIFQTRSLSLLMRCQTVRTEKKLPMRIFYCSLYVCWEFLERTPNM